MPTPLHDVTRREAEKDRARLAGDSAGVTGLTALPQQRVIFNSGLAVNIRLLFSFSLAEALRLGGIGGIGAASASSDASGVMVRQDGIHLRCDQCGTVRSVERNITQGSNYGVAGAIIGAVAGGVLCNQIGKGGSSESYLVRMRMGDGGYNNVQVKDASGIRAGDIVQLDRNGNITRIR